MGNPTCSGKEPFRISGSGFLWAGCPSNQLIQQCQSTKQNTAPITTVALISSLGHTACMYDDADAKMILSPPPSDNWKRPPGRLCILWLNTVQHGLRAYNLTLNKAVDLAQNRPLQSLMSTYGATHS